MLDGPFVKATGFELHHLDLLPDVIDAQWTDQPDRAALDEALDVMPPDQGNVLAEAASVGLDQAGTMLRFLLAHLVEDLRGVRIRVAQTIGEIAVNTAVLLFQGNSQSQNLALGKISELLGHPFLLGPFPRRPDHTASCPTRLRSERVMVHSRHMLAPMTSGPGPERLATIAATTRPAPYLAGLRHVLVRSTGKVGGERRRGT